MGGQIGAAGGTLDALTPSSCNHKELQKSRGYMNNCQTGALRDLRHSSHDKMCEKKVTLYIGL